MTISSSTSRRIILNTAVFFICVLPANALAAIRITDIMYDPPGADQGREWIQITNTGPDAVNLINYRLSEGGTNHKLTVAVGTSTLAAGREAILTADPVQYASEHPSFTGTVFKSSFSLSNTGETIALKDSLLKVADSYSYVAPPVVKEPVPLKIPKATKKTPVSTPAKSTSYSYAANNQTAALPQAQLPTLPPWPNGWLYSLGLVILLLLGTGAALYARPTVPSAAVTGSGSEEFELE